MTYADLMQIIGNMTEEQKQMDVVVFNANSEEYSCVVAVENEDQTDVLDKEHPFLVID